MFIDHYTLEKLIALESRRVIHFRPHELPPRARRPNGIARSVGRAKRRAGERLEAWAGANGGSRSRSEYSPEPRRY